MSSSEIYVRILLVIGLLVNQGESEVSIIEEPKDFTGFMSSFRSLSYKLHSEGNVKYQWTHNGSVIPITAPRIYGQQTTDLLIVTPKFNYQGIYQLYITSAMGRIFGREIKVTFTVVGEFPKREMTTLDVVIGETFSIPCPKHSFTRNAVYKWGRTDTFQGTQFYEANDNVIVLHDGTLFFSHVTAKEVKRIDDLGGLSCLLDGNYDEITKIESSSSFKLRASGTNKTSFGPVLEKIPDTEVVEGKYVILRCIAAGYPTPKYVWKKTDTNGVTTTVLNHINGIQLSYENKILTIEKVREENAGIYKCHATIEENGTRRTDEKQSILKVREEPQWIGRHIKNANPEVLSQYTWTCIAKGKPEPQYHWYANATVMKNQSGKHTIEGGILTFHKVTQEDNGMYQCVAKNKFGFQYQTVSMIVKVKSPSITKLGKNMTLVVGTTGVIQCRSDAIPTAIHEWLKNGVKLEINTTEKYDLRDKTDLVIHNLTKADAGNYACMAKNMFGQATKNIQFSIGEIVFKQWPQDKRNVPKAGQFSLACEAGSDPPLPVLYKWRFQGRDMTHDIWLANVKKLYVFDVKLGASGIYTCVAYVEKPEYVEKVASATVIVRGVPDPPESLMVQGNCSNFEAKLSWKIPYRGSYVPLTRLIIQWSLSRDSSTWYNISDHVNASSDGDVMRGLNAWSDIRFRMFAVNEYGASHASNVTEGKKCTTPASKPRKCPKNVEGTATKPYTIDITWKKVPTVYENGPSFNYIVSYRKPNSTWQRETVGQDSEPRFTIDNAEHDQQWEFMVQSNNSEGPGPQCAVETAQSVKEAPTLAPKFFKHKDIGPRYVDLVWEPSNVLEDKVLGYKITYWHRKVSIKIHSRAIPSCGDKHKPCDILIEDGAKRGHKLDKLTPHNTYTMTLRSYNKGGDSPKSDPPLVFHTEEDTPGPIAAKDIRFTLFGKYIKMEWKPPMEPNGVITGYIATVIDMESAELGGSEREYLFSGLKPEHKYGISIRAKTSAGPGDTVVKVVNTTKIKVPAVSQAPDVLGVSEDSVNVTFKPANSKGGFPERFYVMYKEEGQDDEYLKKTNDTWLVGKSARSHIVVVGLENDKMYVFTTVVMNTDKESGMSAYTPGQPIQTGERDTETPIYRRYWFYIVICLLFLLLLVLFLLFFLRRKPRETYKVSEREEKHGQKHSPVKAGDGYPLYSIESLDEGLPLKGQTYDVIQPERNGSKLDVDSLDDYDGEDDDFSEHGSFIGQYGPGKKPSASQSSLPVNV